MCQMRLTFTQLLQCSSREKTWKGFYNCAFLPISAYNKKGDGKEKITCQIVLMLICYLLQPQSLQSHLWNLRPWSLEGLGAPCPNITAPGSQYLVGNMQSPNPCSLSLWLDKLPQSEY